MISLYTVAQNKYLELGTTVFPMPVFCSKARADAWLHKLRFQLISIRLFKKRFNCCRVFFMRNLVLQLQAWNAHVYKHWDNWKELHPWVEVKQTGLGCEICANASVKKSSWSLFRACKKVPKHERTVFQFPLV